MLGTNRFFIDCMTRQHAVFLESISERDSIIIRFPAQRTGLLTPLLTCFTLLSFSLFTWTNYFESNSLSPFCLFGQKFSQSKLLFFLPFGQKHSKSNFTFTKIFKDNSQFCVSRKIIPIQQNYSKSHFLSDLEKFPLSAYRFYTLSSRV